MTISKSMKNQPTLQNLADFENKSLLIVDDDNPFRERLARAMEKKGFEVFQAEGVQKGIDSVKAKKPGFAVVDLRLGKIDFSAVAKAMGADGFRVSKNEGFAKNFKAALNSERPTVVEIILGENNPDPWAEK